jgi:hypothetical protein
MRRTAPLWLLAACLTSCVGTHELADPTLEISTKGGTELGVATDYGILFLGRTAQGGDVEITAWYGDGPNIESATIEPIGGGLYTAETEIRLPEVPLRFEDPKPGSSLLLIGRKNGEIVEQTVTVRSDPRVLGLLLSVPSTIGDDPTQVGAGVYYLPDDDYDKKQLVGLVSGRIRLKNADGERVYLTAYGPQELWRLVTHRRDLLQRKRWVYREDIL